MNLLYLTLVFPLVSFLLLSFSHGRLSKSLTATIGSGSIGLTTLTSLWILKDFFYTSIYNGTAIYTQTLWNWIVVGNFHIPVALCLDGLSLTMLSLITSISFFIHLYACWYMYEEEGYSRFFAYTNLFVASMLILVLADNLLLMYLGWEGVGLCSYLLIGFYYTELKNTTAAIKAFIITHIGDILLVFSLFILYEQLGTLNFHDITALAQEKIVEGSTVIIWATIMLLGGAIGKSAQLPLQTWLADAMVGPTPVSALIHATTMVTAGVYLIVRTNGLFLMAPCILYLVGIIGAITLIFAGCTALVQSDIKRILAYSTMSQIGYMFLAIGVRAWDAAIFHLMTHAFCKALLFLSTGSVIRACHNEQNIFKIGGLRKSIPLIYICFLVGGASLSAFPIFTSGFYSKDKILWNALANGDIALVIVGLLGSLLTSFYIFRMIFIVFHGEEKIKIHDCFFGVSHYLPLGVLLVLSTFIGAWIRLPLFGIFPTSNSSYKSKLILEIISGAISVIGIYLAAVFWLGQKRFINALAISTPGHFLKVWWLNAWGFDWLYEKIFIKPYLFIAQLLARDPFNVMMNLSGFLAHWLGLSLTVSENGQLRWYVASMGLGAVILLMVLLFK